MAFIQCSLRGSALSWFKRLPQTHKDNWHAFQALFRKQFISQQVANYAKLETKTMKCKDTETV